MVAAGLIAGSCGRSELDPSAHPGRLISAEEYVGMDKEHEDDLYVQNDLDPSVKAANATAKLNRAGR